MRPHSISLPMSKWPQELRSRFQAADLSRRQDRRLGGALGRWLLICDGLGVDPTPVSRETWSDRCSDLSKEVGNDVRQALALVYPDMAEDLYRPTCDRTARKDPRRELARKIDLNLARFPDDWRHAASPLLEVDPDAVEDGILIEAWAASTIVRRVQAAAFHFDFCRNHNLPVDITVASVRADLAYRQARAKKGDARIGGADVHLQCLVGIATALLPGRDWKWLRVARDRMKKISKHHPSRNASRAVDAAELRAFGQALLDAADTEQLAARNHRQMVTAHSRARTALSIILLTEAPIRVTSCAELELEENFLGSLSGILLDESETKERSPDRRAFSSTLVNALTRYIENHRARVVRRGETRLFVGDDGAPIVGATLTSWMGKLTLPEFMVRVTPHAIRHSVANFIVATVPEEAALASAILHHSSDATTEIYRQRANQIVASRRLGAATCAGAAKVGAQTDVLSPTRKSPSRKRQRRRPSKVSRMSRGSRVSRPRGQADGSTAGKS